MAQDCSKPYKSWLLHPPSSLTLPTFQHPVNHHHITETLRSQQQQYYNPDNNKNRFEPSTTAQCQDTVINVRPDEGLAA
jgi:hypothetical protein